jgi:hypothetical protein
MSLVTTATCSYCKEMAEYRVGDNDYELHACPTHKKVAWTEFNLVKGIGSWRMESHSKLRVSSSYENNI